MLQWTLEDGRQEESSTTGFSRNDMFLAEMDHFMSAVASRRPTLIPIDEGIEVLRVVERARRSAELSHRAI